MNTHQLIENLTHPTDTNRRSAALIIGMVQEVDAYSKLAQAYKQERDPNIKAIMQWAGRQLQAAIAQDFTTFKAIWQYFGIFRELQTDNNDPYIGMEGEQFSLTLDQAKADARWETLKSSWLSGKTPTQSTNPLSVMLFDAPRRRVPAIQPAQIEIRPHLRRLQDALPENRRKAALTLRDINNPAALPALGTIYYKDLDPEVRTAAQQAGTQIYWNLLYWEMEQNGIIQREIDQQRAKRPSTATQTIAAVSDAQKEAQKIEALLRSKQQKRRR